MMMVPKSGSPVFGQTEVNSGLTCVMTYRRPGLGFGNVSMLAIFYPTLCRYKISRDEQDVPLCPPQNALVIENSSAELRSEQVRAQCGLILKSVVWL